MTTYELEGEDVTPKPETTRDPAMQFTKAELRMIETMACTHAILQSRHYIDIAIEASKGSPVSTASEMSMKAHEQAVKLYDECMTIAAKAGKQSEE